MPCIEMEFELPPKQQHACTRSFGQPVTRAARRQLPSATMHSVQQETTRRATRAGLSTFRKSSPFRPNDEPFSRCATIQLQPPGSDTTVLIESRAMQASEKSMSQAIG